MALVHQGAHFTGRPVPLRRDGLDELLNVSRLIDSATAVRRV
jgi:hypothetical protein